MRKFKWLGILLGVLLVLGCSSLVLAQEEEEVLWEKTVTMEIEDDTGAETITVTTGLELDKAPLGLTIEWEKEITGEELGTVTLGCGIENWALEWEKELEAEDAGIFTIEFSFSF